MKVERITDFEDFKKIRAGWNTLLLLSEENSIFLTHEWFYSWWKCFSEGKSLEILRFQDEQGEMIGIAPLMTEENILRFIASQEVTDYCDFITAKGRGEEFYENLLGYLKIQYSGIKRIELINIKSSSPTLVFLPQVAPKHDFSCLSFEVEVAPILELPSSYEDFLRLLNRKSRHELRRKLRRMDNLQGVKIVKAADPKGLLTSIETFIDLHRKSAPSKREFWQRRGMVDFFREIILQFYPKKWVKLNFLLHEEKIMASLLNFSYEDQIYFYNIAYNKDYALYSPGLFLFNHCLKQAIIEKKKKADFLRGREKYKYYFGAKESKIFHLTLTLE